MQLKEKMFHEIDIEINHGCNRTCWYCPNSVMQRSEQGEMSLDLFQEVIAQLKSFCYQGKICFHFYNEPILCEKLLEFTKISKAHLPDSKIELVSNGNLLTYEKFMELEECGIDIYTITKHAGSQPIPYEIFSVGLSPEQLKKITFRDHTQLYYSNRAGAIPKLSENKVLPLKRPCYIPTCVAIITVKGNMLACYEDYEQKSAMGNINEKHMVEIWNEPKYKKFRDDLKKGLRDQYDLCSKCDNTKLIQ